ncbi:MAG: Ig-like domain repeat protein [Chloroflexota bacterium]|nr:Ig-like domain repeat protein [Chloroflexota bacterium]
MKKRFHTAWRFTVAFLLLTALVAGALVAPVSVGAVTPPDTYIDPIPEFFNDVPNITGTSVAESDRDVVEVAVQIIRHPDNKYWLDGTGWVVDPETWNGIVVDLAGVVNGPWGDNQYDWDYTTYTAIGAGNLADGKTYSFKARAEDDDGYVDLSPYYRSFTYDETDPDVSISTNISGTVNELTKVQGAAADASPGQLDQVLVKVEDTDNTLFWNGSGWQVDEVWLRATGTTSWQISTTTTPRLPEWTNGVNYSIDVKAWDKASNESAVVSKAFEFRKELSAGQCYIDPVAGSSSDPFLNDLTTITGTSRAKSGSDIDEVKVKITWKGSPTQYWDGTFWMTSLDWEDAPAGIVAGAAVDGHWDWDYTPGITWQYGEEYEIQARAHDDPNDQYYTSGTRSFTFDDQLPNTEIGLITGTVYNTLDEVDGTAWDNSPGKTETVLLTIENVGTGDFWNGSFWQATEIWIKSKVTGSTGTVPWEITYATSPKLPQWCNGGGGTGTDFTITAEAVDKAGNRDTTATKTFTFRYQLSLPTGDPTISRSPTSFSFTAAEGAGNPVDQTLAVWNSGGGTLNWVVNESSGWLSLSPGSGDSIGETDNVAVSVDISGLAVGTYNTNIEISATGATNSPVFVPVQLTVTESIPGAPNTAITAIADYVNSLTEIGGTATDDVQVNAVNLKIQRDSDGKYWTGTTWQSTSTTIAASATDGSFNSASESWAVSTTTTPALPGWENSVTYTVTATAVDNDANSDPTPATESFMYDTEVPDTSITDIADTVSELTTASGTASDNGVLSKVEVSLKNDTDGKYYNGSDWTATTEQWLTASGTDSWSYSVPALSTGDGYTLRARATDTAGNVDNTPDSDSFTFTGAPTPTPGVTPTPTPGVTPTPTPGVTPTPTPTATPTPAATPTPTPTSEVALKLYSIAWTDTDGDGTINPGDKLVFKFTRPVDTTTLDSVAEINERLNSSAAGTSDYGTSFSSSWDSDEDWLTVTLGTGEAITGGETVDPSSDVKDADGNSDATTTPPSVPAQTAEPGWEFLGLAWWIWLIIGLAVIIVIVLLIWLLTRPKKPAEPGEEMYENDMGYGEGEEEF